MSKFEFISLEQARAMSENELKNEIKCRKEYLRKELGIGDLECAEFVASFLEMGAAFNEKNSRR